MLCIARRVPFGHSTSTMISDGFGMCVPQVELMRFQFVQRIPLHRDVLPLLYPEGVAFGQALVADTQ